VYATEGRTLNYPPPPPVVFTTRTSRRRRRDVKKIRRFFPRFITNRHLFRVFGFSSSGRCVYKLRGRWSFRQPDGCTLLPRFRNGRVRHFVGPFERTSDDSIFGPMNERWCAVYALNRRTRARGRETTQVRFSHDVWTPVTQSARNASRADTSNLPARVHYNNMSRDRGLDALINLT